MMRVQPPQFSMHGCPLIKWQTQICKCEIELGSSSDNSTSLDSPGERGGMQVAFST